jgi:hypothetical protein
MSTKAGEQLAVFAWLRQLVHSLYHFSPIWRTVYEADFSFFLTMKKPNPKPISVVIPKTPTKRRTL